MNRVNVSSHYFIYFYLSNLTPLQRCGANIQGTLIWYRRMGADADLKLGAQKRGKKFKGAPILCCASQMRGTVGAHHNGKQ